MSQNQQNKTTEPENIEEQLQAVKPEDLVMKSGYIVERDPEEILSNPAVVPQMPDDRRDDRGDLTKD
ncbi:MAG TPA: hypothetical protein DCY91_15345 [Cyanobacteria bacterium UBA11370]|nr:hypothetical protein [Cyanobacteria bacterium UBA11370]HBY75421.1 hypothetical protein [Cyanobacteria bacterium UBA11148]